MPSRRTACGGVVVFCLWWFQVHAVAIVETIGANCFRDCVGIDTITIRNNVTSLGGGAFRNCINVQYAYIDIPECRSRS